MKETFLSIFVFAMFPIHAWCQDSAVRPSVSDCGIREVFNAGGWEVPGLSGARIITPSARWVTNGVRDVFVEVLKPNQPESMVDLVRCSPGRPDRIEVRRQAVKVLEILKFRINGRVFAYRVTAQLVGSEHKGIRTPLGVEMMLTFYDEAGSGSVTVMQYPGTDLIPRLDVPNWPSQPPK